MTLESQNDIDSLINLMFAELCFAKTKLKIEAGINYYQNTLSNNNNEHLKVTKDITTHPLNPNREIALMDIRLTPLNRKKLNDIKDAAKDLGLSHELMAEKICNALLQTELSRIPPYLYTGAISSDNLQIFKFQYVGTDDKDGSLSYKRTGPAYSGISLTIDDIDDLIDGMDKKRYFKSKNDLIDYLAEKMKGTDK